MSPDSGEGLDAHEQLPDSVGRAQFSSGTAAIRSALNRLGQKASVGKERGECEPELIVVAQGVQVGTT